jgi:hypothetical protein
VIDAANLERATSIATFRRRCAIAVADWLAGKLDLHTAVDGLAARTHKHGIHVDTAQQILATAFKPHRRPGDNGEPP